MARHDADQEHADMPQTATADKHARRRSRATAWVMLACCLGLSACATLASHDEYEDYRAVRLAGDERDELRAMQRYVANHPEGMWADEVQQTRTQREPEVWVSNNTTLEGLQWYLEAYPNGRFAEQARPRLAALQSVATRRQEEAANVQQHRREQRQTAIEARRTWVTRAVQFWTRTMLGIRNYGAPISRVARGNPDFSRAFGQAPTPVCDRGYCLKRYGQSYSIPMPGATRIERRVDVYLRILLERGRVERLELLLPNKGFSRWYELENRTLITDEDPEQREIAISWALERITDVLREGARGASEIDFIPENLLPLPEQDVTAAEDAPDAKQGPATPAEEGDEAAASETPAAAPAEAEGEEAPVATPPTDDSLDDLLSAAAGPGPQETAPAAETAAPVETVQPEVVTLPTGLLAIQLRNLRVVIFSASADDYGSAFDGIFVERMRD